MPQLYVTMPQPGETITEGTIVSWMVKPGDAVDEGRPLAELETEKAVFEYESPFAGKVVKILHGNGERVKVAEPIAIMDVAQEKSDMYVMMGIAKLVEHEASGKSSPNEFPVSSGSGILQGSGRSAGITLTKQETHSESSCLAPKMSPQVRRLAKEHNLSEADLNKMAALCEGGRITKEIIEDWVAGKSGSVQSVKKTVSATGDYDNIPCSAIRMRIADNMVLSKSKIPHAHTAIAVDVTELVKFRDKHKDSFKSRHGTNLNFLSLVFPALVKALQKYSIVNASYVDKTTPHEIHVFKKINLGIAVGSEHGLFIPVIHDIAHLSFENFNKSLNDKVARAQAKKLMPQDMEGTTVTFNNYGFFGTTSGVQVIQYPMAATLGMSVIEKRVVVVKDQPAVRTLCDFSLAFDHRVIDGREAGLFLSELKKQVESIDFSVFGLS